MGSCISKQSKSPKQVSVSNKERKLSSVLMTTSELERLRLEEKNTLRPTSMRFPSKGKEEQGSIVPFPGKLILEGQNSNAKQLGFEEKRQSINSTTISSEHLSTLGISVACKKGLKPDCPNQDDYFIAIDSNLALLGVFDGHGPFGHDISNYIQQSLPPLISLDPDLSSSPEIVLKNAFDHCQTLLLNLHSDPNSLIDCSISGTTATLSYIHNHKIYIAHVGDSRAVMGQLINNEITAKNLTTDHRPNLAAENARIVSSGGEVRKLSEDSPYRIFFPGENYPGLNMSRSFGDIVSRDLGVVSEPDVDVFDIQTNDKFLLICSDGVWEFITSQEAVSLVNKCNGDAKLATERLSALAWMRWKQRFSTLVDDITVVIVYLDNYREG